MLNVGAFLNTLPLMAYGLGGIFVVISILIAVVKLLFILFPEKNAEEK